MYPFDNKPFPGSSPTGTADPAKPDLDAVAEELLGVSPATATPEQMAQARMLARYYAQHHNAPLKYYGRWGALSDAVSGAVSGLNEGWATKAENLQNRSIAREKLRSSMAEDEVRNRDTVNKRFGAPPPLPPERKMDSDGFYRPNKSSTEPIVPQKSPDVSSYGDNARTFADRSDKFRSLARDQYGLDLDIGEGYRDNKGQAAAYAKGPSVTNAKPGFSYHNYDAAADFVPKNMPNAQAAKVMKRIFDENPSMGLTGGVNFKSPYDPFHVQLGGVGINGLRNGVPASGPVMMPLTSSSSPYSMDQLSNPNLGMTNEQIPPGSPNATNYDPYGPDAMAAALMQNNNGFRG